MIEIHPAFEHTVSASDVYKRQLLACAGYTLSHNQRFDVIVEYFMVNGMHDIFTINQVLFEYDQPLLGGTNRD